VMPTCSTANPDLGSSNCLWFLSQTSQLNALVSSLCHQKNPFDNKTPNTKNKRNIFSLDSRTLVLLFLIIIGKVLFPLSRKNDRTKIFTAREEFPAKF
jgi:hypothetical protein